MPTGSTLFTLDKQGWLAPSVDVTLRPSPNFNERPSDTAVSLLVVHNITLPPGQFGTPYITDLFLNQLDIAADPWFVNVEGLKVSAHFVIDRLGHINQFVSCDDRAWHAGASSFEGREQCNDFSIGVELEGTDDVPFEAVQYERLAALTQCLRGRYPLTAATGHSDIAPGRKTDPGPCFDWSHFSALAQWPVARRG
ncbi:MAG: 1,6-anhydro-N-acetylmuramyl-L-alanine amidase AmpD [Burkholderiaceae bacterium]|jgi:AmpD protein|nr:1,6-anhydro-N-acetylmuramyl-L-alanine amidase AmpD [Burkholderiaceae bacterium]